jgi:L-serine dehydratase
MANEMTWHTEEYVRAGLLKIWSVMQECIQAGIDTTIATLPGGLKVRRRAPQLAARLSAAGGSSDPLIAMDRVNLYAIAVNEENAAGGRVVTAPTNGAAGIIPAVLQYFHTFVDGADDDATVRFLLVAAGIGSIIKENASISGAEVGCQGEVGSACSMAAAGLTELLGGTPWQVENAAEIGIEHNLGLTCDPVGGLVQIPCIERNAVGAVKAITAARIALSGDGMHQVSLDKAVKTMRETGADMKDKYKETARGGLALNVVEC